MVPPPPSVLLFAISHTCACGAAGTANGSSMSFSRQKRLRALENTQIWESRARSRRSDRVSPGLENDEGNGRRKQVADGAGRVHRRNHLKFASMS